MMQSTNLPNLVELQNPPMERRPIDTKSSDRHAPTRNSHIRVEIFSRGVGTEFALSSSVAKFACKRKAPSCRIGFSPATWQGQLEKVTQTGPLLDQKCEC
jgi:hypothetical protein